MALQGSSNEAEVDERAPLLNPNLTSGADTSANASKSKDEVSVVIIWMVIPILLAGVFLSNVVSSVVIATNQQIASEFGALSSAAWLLTTYTLSQSASQPLYGKLSNIFGRKPCLIFCWIFFGLGCLLVGFGQSYWQVLLGRAISGVGSAGKIALTSVIVADLVPLRKVASYRAYVNLTATTARSIGGPIGGWLAGSIGWRWCFMVQFPIALIGLALVLWKLPELKTNDLCLDATEPEKVSKISRVDFAGVFTLVGTILTGLLALDMAAKGTSLLLIFCLCAAFLVSVTSFILAEKKFAKEPILPLDLISKRDVLTSYLIIGFQAAGQFGLLYSIPVYFQVIQRESISLASTRIVPVVVGNALGTIVSGKLISQTKKYRALTASGNLLGLLGFLLILLRWCGKTNWLETLFVAFPGMGMGIIQSTTFIHLAASLTQSEIAIAGTSWFLAQNVGALVGASLSIPLINKVLLNGLQKGLLNFEDKAEIIARVTSNIQNIHELPEKTWVIVSKAYIRALLASDGLSLSLVTIALIVTMSMQERPL